MKRLFEPSTWAGLAAILQAAKTLTAPQHHIVLDGATALAGVVAGLLTEKGAAK
jgi:hypothetical protein